MVPLNFHSLSNTIYQFQPITLKLDSFALNKAKIIPIQHDGKKLVLVNLLLEYRKYLDFLTVV